MTCAFPLYAEVGHALGQLGAPEGVPSYRAKYPVQPVGGVVGTHLKDEAHAGFEQSISGQGIPEELELEVVELTVPLVDDVPIPPIPPPELVGLPELVLVGDPLEVELDDPPVFRSNTYPDRQAIGMAAVTAKSTAVPSAVRACVRQADIRTSPRC